LDSNIPSEKIIEIPNCVDTSFFSPQTEAKKAVRTKLKISEGSMCYIFAGRYIDRKGYNSLINAWKKFIKMNKNDPYLITLGYDLNNLSQRYSDEANNIIDLGKLDEEGVRDMMRASNYFILPSTAEGHSVAMIEAMSSGLVPIIYSDVAGMEHLDENMAVHIPHTSDPINNIIFALNNSCKLNHDELDLFSQRNRDYALTHYGISTITQQYLNLV
jgi:glycosyltransferase involved in cell wall biosynthesis